MSYIFFAELIVFIFLLYCFHDKYTNKIVFLFSLLLALNSAFLWNPDGGDILQHYKELELYRIYGFEYIKIEILWLKAILFYIISLMPYNNLLPGVTIFIFYFTNLILIQKACKNFSVRRDIAIVAMLYFVLTYDYLAQSSGIRGGLTYTIFNFFLYKELIEKKFVYCSWIAYISSIFLHPTAIILLITRIILLCKNGIIYKVFILCFFLVVPFSSIIAKYISNFSFLNVLVFQLISEKMLSYSDYDSWDTGIWTYCYYLGILFIQILIYSFYQKRSNCLYKINRFYVLIIIFSSGAALNYFIINNYTIFSRSIFFIPFWSSVYLAVYLQEFLKFIYKEKYKLIFYFSIEYLFIFIILIYFKVVILYSFLRYWNMPILI